MKKKIITVIFALFIAVLGLGITYSSFVSEQDLIMNQGIASFIFETNQTDQISLSLSDLKPGDNVSYNFSVSNSRKNDSEVDISNVTINYQIIISTFHFIPLKIELYKDDSDEAILVCDESYSRNDSKEVVCSSEVQNMSFEENVFDEYTLKANFDSKYSDIEYSDLIDFIDIEIKSWQKVGDVNEEE